MSVAAEQKILLRRKLRRLRQTLGSEAQLLAATSLVASVEQLPQWRRAQTLAVYRPADGEIGTDPLIARASQLDKAIYLPVIGKDQSLSFALWRSGVPLRPNRYGIGEPPPDAPRLAFAELDLLFMPMVAWDANGGRLGMGGGFYDRTLGDARLREPGVRPLLVGLAHDCQQVERVPLEPWDIALDYVVTGTRLHLCSSAEPA